MNRLQLYLLSLRNSLASNIARDALMDESLTGIANDVALDSGEMDMNCFEIGRSYEFKTFGMFYVGRIRSANASCIILEAASMVVDQGELGSMLTQGTITYQEHYPSGYLCYLNPIHVYAASDWHIVLPNDSWVAELPL